MESDSNRSLLPAQAQGPQDLHSDTKPLLPHVYVEQRPRTSDGPAGTQGTHTGHQPGQGSLNAGVYKSEQDFLKISGSLLTQRRSSCRTCISEIIGSNFGGDRHAGLARPHRHPDSATWTVVRALRAPAECPGTCPSASCVPISYGRAGPSLQAHLSTEHIESSLFLLRVHAPSPPLHGRVWGMLRSGSPMPRNTDHNWYLQSMGQGLR